MAPLKDRSVDPRKAALVVDFLVDFLKEAFPGHDVHDTEDFSRGCQFYRIDERGTGRVLHRVRLSRVFLDDHTERQVIRTLEDWQVPTIIRQAGPNEVRAVWIRTRVRSAPTSSSQMPTVSPPALMTQPICQGRCPSTYSGSLRSTSRPITRENPLE